MDHKTALHTYLRLRRAELLGKVENLSEYDARRPLTPTGTNLLGLVKHVATVQLGYFGETFGRPSDKELPWLQENAEPDSDMWVPANESREEIIEFHHYSARHSDETIEALSLDAPGVVPWWPEERRNVSLHQILVHMCVETARHAGHADIIRELIDGSAGMKANDANMPARNSEESAAYRYRIEEAARTADLQRY
ncbi:DinB family protein [Arthrobacter sp. fls2-241-R2A-200]|uniref:DinB family protein n=1 Tax=Arthrobacter sp. fls2-241-R2A-200 TaxID=3040281 RepID=UPI00254EC36C|nr:DinB family protein [Arthrobacter sp. fls2-241-R2A-200]